MRPVILFVLMGLSGCATAKRNQVPDTLASSDQQPANFTRATAAHVTRYELGAYRYPATESERGQAFVLRTTRVPPHALPEPDADTISVAFEPLPPSAELAAELAAQRDITEQLRAIQAAMAVAERKAQEQYGALVSQSEEVLKLRHQLEAERARLRELESQLEQRMQAAEAPAVVAESRPASTSTEGVKW